MGGHSYFDTAGSDQIQAFGGGGGGSFTSSAYTEGSPGGNGGGGSYGEDGGASTQTSNGGATGYGNVGGNYSVPYSAAGGGAGEAGNTDGNALGGDGKNDFLTDVSTTAALLTAISHGDSGYLAGGGGGGAENNNGTARSAGGDGGGGDGGSYNSQIGGDGTDNTGGGGGGMGRSQSNSNGAAGDGGNGIVIMRYADTAILDLTLQSSDTTAEAAPTKADMVMLIEDAGSGVGTVNTHIKGWVSRYETGGTKTWTEGVLVDEGDWGTDKRILAFHDLSLTGTSGTQMAYKITTHSASTVYNTKIHATSIGWR